MGKKTTGAQGAPGAENQEGLATAGGCAARASR
jgi:hypothetical protein